jgi:hypothetical protein
LVRQARAGEIQANVHRVTVLDAVEAGIVQKLWGLKGCDERARQRWLDTIRSTVPDEDVWNEEYMCQPSSEQSSLLSYELIRSCEAGDLRLAQTVEALPTSALLYAGYDVGRKHDRSALVSYREPRPPKVFLQLRLLDERPNLVGTHGADGRIRGTVNDRKRGRGIGGHDR